MKADKPSPTVHRFSLPAAPTVKVRMIEGAVLLDVLPSKNGWDAFAMVDPAADKEWRYFVLIGTGMPVPHGWDLVHVRSIRTSAGPMVHLFEAPAHIAKKVASIWKDAPAS